MTITTSSSMRARRHEQNRNTEDAEVFNANGVAPASSAADLLTDQTQNPDHQTAVTPEGEAVTVEVPEGESVPVTEEDIESSEVQEEAENVLTQQPVEDVADLPADDTGINDETDIPSRGASKADWLAYAERQGKTDLLPEGAGRDAIAEFFLGPKS